MYILSRLYGNSESEYYMGESEFKRGKNYLLEAIDNKMCVKLPTVMGVERWLIMEDVEEESDNIIIIEGDNVKPMMFRGITPIDFHKAIKTIYSWKQYTTLEQIYYGSWKFTQYYPYEKESIV